MKFQAIQKTFAYTQLNSGNIKKVFPLLCPVREKDWLDGWDYKMIYSNSGLIEKDCVFTTPNKHGNDTVWQVTQYDKKNYYIEFLRVTPNINVVKINISLEKINQHQTKTHIIYRYTALNEKENSFIENKLKDEFRKSMKWWEKALNHYLTTGKKLLKAATPSIGNGA